MKKKKAGMAMEYRMMKKLGLRTSLLGFGCMRLPKQLDGKIDRTEAQALIDLAIAQGVNYFDTAYFYHDGESEAFVGDTLAAYPRENFYLATKMPMIKVTSLAQAKEIFADQLKRLRVDFFDFYLLHALDRKKWARTLDLEILKFLEEMKSEGKIKNLGFSFHDQYDVFEEILQYYPWDFCQIQLNYMDVGHQQGMKGYGLAESLDIPVVIVEPVKGGALAALPEEIAKLFKDYHPEASLASWALRWIAGLPQVKVVLSGMSDRDQVADNLATFSAFRQLEKAELHLVEQVAEKLRQKTNNGCTACGYCMPCPFGVNIPACFKVWNEQAMYRQPEKIRNSYHVMMTERERADQCRQCGQCEKLCPQKIAIREDLARVVKDLAEAEQ